MTKMNLSVVVLDYDVTIAHNGVLHPEVRAAIAEIRASGLTVVLATGRILRDLQRLLGDLRLVDAVVAENGAVLAFPESGRSTALGAAPANFVESLRRRNVQVRKPCRESSHLADRAHPHVRTRLLSRSGTRT